MNKLTKMKFFAFALVAFVAGANAVPQQQLEVAEAIRSGEPRLVTNQIEQAIKDASRAIVDAGLDPFILDHQSTEYALPVPSIFNYRASIADVLCKGASNIAINRLNFGVALMRLQLDISLPEILLEIGNSELDLIFFGKNFKAGISGSVVVKNIRVTGTFRFNVGIITGTTLRSIDMGFELGGIQSELNVEVLGRVFSNAINNYLQETIPRTLNDFKGEINELFTGVAKEMIESML